MDDADGGFAGASDGDKLMQALDVARARMSDESMLPLKLRSFAQKWDAFKRDEGVVDFTDLVRMAIEQVPTAPGEPEILYADEVQDMSPLEMTLLRHWAKSAEKLIISGDDDQNLFHFRGSRSDAFLNPPIPEDRKKVLSQSYRVPHAVHAVANDWIQRLPHREPKEYSPRDAEGLVRQLNCTLADPATLLNDIRKQTEQGRSVMVLATCGYMLDPLKHEMKRQGHPFGNRWRRSRTDWNPLIGNGRGVSSVERVLAYLVMDETMFGDAARLWTGEDVKRWTHLVKKQGLFRRGATGMIAALPDRELTYEEVAGLFDDEAVLAQAVQPSLAWLRANLLAGAQKTAAFPITVAERHGGQALLAEPLTTAGTVHSTKGGEADVTYLSPQLSYAGYKEWGARGQAVGEDHDAITRCMYVGMTRAREELVILQPENEMSVAVEDLLRGAGGSKA